MGNCAAKPKTNEGPVTNRAKIETPRQQQAAAQKKNKPATPPKHEADSRGPRPDPFAATSSETKWITPSAKKTEKVIIEPESLPVVEPEPEPVIEQVIDEPEQAQQTSADVAEDEQKEIDANAVNDFADALSGSCKRVALDEIEIQKDDAEGETIITPDFVEETLIQPIQRQESTKNRIEGKTLFDFKQEPEIEKKATQEVDAFIEEEIIAPIERQESLKNRVEGKTFEEYEKAQKEADDLADVGKEIEAALNELESSQTALDSVRQANLEATIEAVTKQSTTRAQSEIKDEFEYVQKIGKDVTKFQPADSVSDVKSTGPQYSSLADAPIIYDDLDEEYFSARSSVVSPPSTKFDTAESRDVFSNETSRNDELEEEDIEDEIIDGALQSNSIEEELEGVENNDLVEPQECGIMEDQEAPSIQKIHLRNVVDAPKDDEIVQQALTKPEEEPGNMIHDYETNIQSADEPAEELSQLEDDTSDEKQEEVRDDSLEKKEDPISVLPKEDIVHHGLIEIIPKDGSEIITKEYEVVDRSQLNAPEDISDYTSEAQESSQTDVEDFKPEISDFPTEMDVLSEPDSRESYHPLESMIRHLSLDVNMDETLVPEILEPVVQNHEESKCKETLDKLALSLADDFENKDISYFRDNETPSTVEKEQTSDDTPEKEIDNSGSSEIEPCCCQPNESEEEENQIQSDKLSPEEKVLDTVEDICKEWVPTPEAYVPVFDYSRPPQYEEQIFEKEYVPDTENFVPVFDYSRPPPYEEQIFEKVEEPTVDEPELVKSDLQESAEITGENICNEYVPNPETYVTVFDYSRPPPYEEQIFDKVGEPTVDESDLQESEEIAGENICNEYVPNPETYVPVFDYSRPPPSEEQIFDKPETVYSELDSEHQEFSSIVPVTHDNVENFFRSLSKENVNDERNEMIEKESFIPVYDYGRPAPFEEKPLGSSIDEEACDLQNNDECEYDSPEIKNVEAVIEEKSLLAASQIVDFEDPIPSPPVYDAVDLENNDEPFEVVEQEYIPVYDYSRPAPAGDLIMVIQDDSGTKIYMPEIGADEISVKVLDLEATAESSQEPAEVRVEEIVEEINEPASEESIEAEIERPTHENVENFFRSISRENINKIEDEQSPLDKIAHQLSLDVEVDQLKEPKEEVYKVKDERNDEDIDRFASEMVKQVLASDDLLESDEEEIIEEKSSNVRKLEVSTEKVRDSETKEGLKPEPPTPEVEVLEIDGEYYAYEVRKSNKYLRELETEKEKEPLVERESPVKTENYTSEKTDDAEDLYRESSEDESSEEEDPCPKRVSFSERPAELIGTQAEPTETVKDLPVVNESPFSDPVTPIEKEEEMPTFDYCLSPEVKEEPPVFDLTETKQSPEIQKEVPEALDIENNDEKDYEIEPSEDITQIKPEIEPTEGIEDFRKPEEQDHLDIADNNECTEPDLENNDENEYVPVFDYSRPAPQEDQQQFQNEAVIDENNNETVLEQDDLDEPESLEHLTQDHVENFFKSFSKPSPQPVDAVEYESEEETSLSDEEKALEEEIKKAKELEQLESQLDKLENQYLEGEQQEVSLPQEVESFIEKLRATTPTPAEEPEPQPAKDPRDMTPEERLKMINKDILGCLEPVELPTARIQHEIEDEPTFGCRVESDPKFTLTPEPVEIELKPEIELQPEVVLEPEVEEDSTEPEEKKSKIDNEILSVYGEYSTEKNKRQLESFYAVKLGNESPKEEYDQAELELECQEIPSTDSIEETETKTTIPVKVELDVDVDTIEEEDEDDDEVANSELVVAEQVVSNITSVTLLTENEPLQTELTEISALQESEILTVDKAEAKSEAIDPSELANEPEASITTQDEINTQPQMEKQDSEEASEEIVAESVTDKSIEFEEEQSEPEDSQESQESVIEAPAAPVKVAFAEPDEPKTVGFSEAPTVVAFAEPEPDIEPQEEFESSFINRIAEEMINSIILEATRIVEDDQQNDVSEKDDSDPFQVSQSSKISMEDNIDDEISIPTDDELEHVSDDEIKVRQLSTDSTDELLNVPSPLARPDEPSPTVMTPAVLETPDSQTFFPENDQTSEPGDNIYDFVEEELEPGDDIHGLIDSARESREASLKGSQRSINKLVQSIDDDVPDIYSKPAERPSTPERIADQLQESKPDEPITIVRKSSITVSTEALEREGSPTRVEINVAPQSPQILKHTINIKSNADKED